MTPFVGDLARANAVATDTTGRILAAGFARREPVDHACDIAVVRYDPDGTLDDTFNGSGIVLVDVRGTDDMAQAIALQPDGRIVLAGSVADKETGSHHPFAARLDAHGILDTSFGGSGVTVNPNVEGAAQCAIVLTDGTILTAGHAIVAEQSDGGGHTELRRFAVMAYRPDGQMVDQFGVDGVLILDLGGMSDEVTGIGEQPDGRIILGGTTRTTTSATPIAVRLDAIDTG